MRLSGLACRAWNLSINWRIRWSRSSLSAASPETARPRNKRHASRADLVNGLLELIRLCAFWFLRAFIVCLFLFLVVVSQMPVGRTRSASFEFVFITVE